MGKPKYSEGASAHDKKAYAKFLSEDEELIMVTGYGKAYLRNRLAFHIIIPGGIFILLGLVLAYFGKVNIGYGLLAGLLVAVVIATVKVMWINAARKYILTTRRVIIKHGLFSVRLTSALYDKITHLEVDQAFIDRIIYHHGTLIISTAGQDKGELKLEYIEDPLRFKSLLERLINREREQYGHPSGAVLTVEGEIVEE